MPTTQTANEAESKADKFKRLAVSRVNKALDTLTQIGNLSAKANYDYTPEQIVAILDVLGDKLNTIEELFAGKKAATEGFTL